MSLLSKSFVIYSSSSLKLSGFCELQTKNCECWTFHPWTTHKDSYNNSKMTFNFRVALDSPGGVPFECGMGGGVSCLSLIGIWGVGAVGQCLNNLLGFRIGQGGFQYAILQVS